METIPVSRLRADLQRVLQRVMSGEHIAITSRGRQVAQLLPPDDAQRRSRQALADLAATAKIGDIISPVDAEWEAAR